MRIYTIFHGFLPCILFMVFSLFYQRGVAQPCRISFTDNGSPETGYFSTSACNVVGLQQLILDNVSKGDVFIFDSNPDNTLQELTINFAGSGNNPGVVRIENGVTVSMSSNLNMNGNKGILEVLGTLNVGGVVNASGNNHTFNIEGTMDVDGNFVAGVNADFNIDGNLSVGGDFDTGNNGNFSGSGSVVVFQDFNPGNNNTSCSPSSDPLCSNFYVLGNCIGNSPICNIVTFGAPTNLPVDWLDFDFEKSREGVILRWQTASELNNSHFDIERKSVAYDTEFRKIGEVKGVGNSQQVETYQFLDPRPSVGINLYRLRQVDFDGTDDYSSTVEVLFDTRALANPVVLFPNPIQHTLQVQILPELQSRGYTIELLDLQGKMIAGKKVNSSNTLQQFDFDLKDLPNGMYIYRIIDGSEIMSGKIIKK